MMTGNLIETTGYDVESRTVCLFDAELRRAHCMERPFRDAALASLPLGFSLSIYPCLRR